MNPYLDGISRNTSKIMTFRNTGIGHAIDDLGEKMFAKTILIIPKLYSLCKLICWLLLTVGNTLRIRCEYYFFAIFATGGKTAKLGSHNHFICVSLIHSQITKKCNKRKIYNKQPEIFVHLKTFIR